MASVPGGSLGYTCSNANPPTTGWWGLILGLESMSTQLLNGATWFPGYTAEPGDADTVRLLWVQTQPHRLRGAAITPGHG